MKQFLTFILFTLLFACQSPNTDSNSETKVPDETSELAEFEFFKVFSNMPTPLDELGHMFNDSISFNGTLMTNISDLNDENDKKLVGLYCGAYIVDMVYQAVYGNTKNTLNYANATHDLFAGLNIPSVFEELIQEAENDPSSLTNDDLKNNIEATLERLEMHLAENDRMVIASQLMMGSWIQMQYILTQSILNKKDDQIAEDLKYHVFEQREHLDNLILLLKEVKEEAGLHDEMNHLNELEASFLRIHSTEEVTHEIVVELANQIATIRGEVLNN